MKYNICLEEKEKNSVRMSQIYKNDDLEYVSKNNETNITKKM
jgi:hypothetical protein